MALAAGAALLGVVAPPAQPNMPCISIAALRVGRDHACSRAFMDIPG
eukprot:SAG31_NODE_33204_length_346_cov_1.461538_1_plen_46_part_01